MEGSAAAAHDAGPLSAQADLPEKRFVVTAVEGGPSPGTRRVRLDDGSLFVIGTAYLPPGNEGAFLCPGAALDPEAAAALRHAADCRETETAALRLIARAEQCSAGLSRKLERRKCPSRAIRTVLVRLLELDLIDDWRYAKLWLKSRVARGKKGPRTLETALRAKGIDRKTAASALKTALAGDGEAKLLERCAKKAVERKRQDVDTDLRFFLKREGFSSAAIEAFFGEKDL
ncbi:MAG: RecX family transcriptional regulator [Spirochaetaceae bacterium]|jgi:regulatory protein|nr:RecX family transcriptional regulator [Spirochaetaceae bacterium]